MQMRLRYNIIAICILLALLLALPLLGACSGGDAPAPAPTPTTTPTPAPGESEFDVVKDAVAAYLPNKAGNTKASDLFMKIAEDDAPYIVSLRNAADYANGHIPGAVNIKFNELSTLPKDENILVYCLTGQTASFAASVLGVLGYDVQNLKHGMSAWSTDPDVYRVRFDPAADQKDYQVETTANEATKTYDFPELDNTTSANSDEIVSAAVATVSDKYITATDLNMKIAEDEDMTIISVQGPERYAAGHVPGAINIEVGSLAENLDKIDLDSPVYAYCDTGHTAAQAASLLQMLGYDAYSLKYGICSWTTDETVTAGKCFDASTIKGYKVEK